MSLRACADLLSKLNGRRHDRRLAHWLSDLLLLTPSTFLAAPDAAFRQVKVYAVPGRFGGWPANHGLWSWGNEILVGFSAGHYKDLGPGTHNIDHGQPEEHLLARSL